MSALPRPANDAVHSALAGAVRDAVHAQRALVIRGSGSKEFLTPARSGTPLDTRAHRGIIDYQPTELVVTARCGTPLVEIHAALAEHGQYLPFEPPHFAVGATIGGCVASGLSGPGRATRGAVRDYILGVTVADGRANVLRFGGTVMKNVAGYDVARLYAGSFGTLGVILDVSLKVLPIPAAMASVQFELDQPRAIDFANRLAAQALPISAACWQGGLFTLRLSGATSAVEAACLKLGGRRLSEAASGQLWELLREQIYPFFHGDAPLWRFSVPSTTPAFRLEDEPLIEWGGALRWFRSTARPQAIHAIARERGGHATLFRGTHLERAEALAQAPRAPAIARIEERLREQFDPQRLFNQLAPIGAAGPAATGSH